MTYRGKWLSDPQDLTFEVSDRIARITLNKPDKRNALSPRTIQEIHDAMLEADDRLDVNAIILAGAGKDFCAGYDLAGVYSGRQAESEIVAATWLKAPLTFRKTAL